MNQFQSIDSGKGILKQSYETGNSPLYEALQRRNKKRKEKYIEEEK